MLCFSSHHLPPSRPSLLSLPPVPLCLPPSKSLIFTPRIQPMTTTTLSPRLQSSCSPSITKANPKNQTQNPSSYDLKIAIIGFGNYGQFLAKTLISQGHTVLAHSRSDHSLAAKSLGVSFFLDPHDLWDSFDLYYGLFMYNRNVLEMLERLDLAFDDLRKQLFGRLHEVVRKQLFGNAESRKVVQENYSKGHLNGAAALSSSSKSVRFQGSAQTYKYEAENSRCSDDSSKLKIAIVGFGNFGQFLAKTFVQQGHSVLAYSRANYSDAAQKLGVSYFSNADDLCEEHPEVIVLCTSILSTEKVLKSLPFQRLKRRSQFITHTMGRVLERLGMESTPVNTKGYETLLNLVENTAGDSFDLYYGLFMYNVNAMEQLERLDLAFESLKDQLFGRLHGVLRKQLFGSSDNSQDLSEEPSDAKFSQNSAALVSSSLETRNGENN
ncbi:hypothetical protein D5086_012300 [Populus alba]|uniref:Uncharacterized protein n=1 Tax=Populus alba TaxID=43335 RepID=A0ACC4C2B5_POPAL